MSLRVQSGDTKHFHTVFLGSLGSMNIQCDKLDAFALDSILGGLVALDQLILLILEVARSGSDSETCVESSTVDQI